MFRQITLFSKSGFLLLCIIMGYGRFAVAQHWIELTPTGGPPPVTIFGASIVYDSANQRLILFGGNNGSGPINDVWVLTNANGLGGLPNWTKLVPLGGPPAPRDNHAAVYDEANNRMIIFGGCAGGCLPALNDVWVLTHANGLGGTPTWMQLGPTGGPPAPRISMASAYDPASNELILFGGQNGGGFDGIFSDVWTLSHANGLGGSPVWTNVSYSGGPAAGQYRPGYSFDSTNNRLLLAGGDANNGTLAGTNAVWVLADANNTASTPTWINVVSENSTGAPPDFESWPAVFDPLTNHMILVTGTSRNNTFHEVDAWLINNANGVSGPSSWTRLLTIGTSPPAKPGAEGSAYDPSSNRLIAYINDTSTNTDQVWVLTNANGATAMVMVSPSAQSISTAQPLNVTVTVNAGSGKPTPTGSVTLTSGNFNSGAATLNSGNATITVPAGALQTGADTLTATYNGDSNYISNTGTSMVMVTIPVPPSFTITGTSVTVPRGAVTTSTVTVIPGGGFIGSVGLTAAITSGPIGAQNPPTVSFGSTTPVNIGNSNGAIAMLTISTTAPSSAALRRPQSNRGSWYAAGGVALACVLLVVVPAPRRSRWTTLGILLIVLVDGVLACGGGGGSKVTGTSNPGTTAGAYTVTVTGTSGSTTSQGLVTVTVQ